MRSTLNLIILSLSSLVLTNPLIQSIFLTQASKVQRYYETVKSNAASVTHHRAEGVNANKNKVLKKSFPALEKCKYICSWTTSSEFSMRKRKKQRKVNPTKCSKVTRRALLWAGQYVFMGFKTDQWLDTACVSHMSGGSLFVRSICFRVTQISQLLFLQSCHI